MPCSAHLSDLGKPQEWRSHVKCRQAACVSLLEPAHFCVLGETTHSTPLQQTTATTEYDASKGKTIFCFCKRTFDIVFSACVTAVLVIPVGAACIAIASETPGSPVYSQERIGRNGKTIRVLKLRSMVADAGNVERYLDPDQLRQWQVERKVDNDPRITRVGRIIRKTSLASVIIGTPGAGEPTNSLSSAAKPHLTSSFTIGARKLSPVTQSIIPAPNSCLSPFSGVLGRPKLRLRLV